MENVVYNANELLQFSHDSLHPEEMNDLKDFLSRTDVQISPSKNFSKKNTLHTLENREWALRKAHRAVKGLSNLILILRQIEEPLSFISFRNCAYLGFVVFDPVEKIIHGFMLLKKPEDIEQRRAAFRQDGSYEEY